MYTEEKACACVEAWRDGQEEEISEMMHRITLDEEVGQELRCMGWL